MEALEAADTEEKKLALKAYQYDLVVTDLKLHQVVFVTTYLKQW